MLLYSEILITSLLIALINMLIDALMAYKVKCWIRYTAMAY